MFKEGTVFQKDLPLRRVVIVDATASCVGKIATFELAYGVVYRLQFRSVHGCRGIVRDALIFRAVVALVLVWHGENVVEGHLLALRLVLRHAIEGGVYYRARFERLLVGGAIAYFREEDVAQCREVLVVQFHAAGVVCLRLRRRLIVRSICWEHVPDEVSN